MGTKRRLNCLRVWGKHLLQVQTIKDTCPADILGKPSKTRIPRETPESLDVMVTQTGRPGVIFNGVADWVYEEEVTSFLIFDLIELGENTLIFDWIDFRENF